MDIGYEVVVGNIGTVLQTCDQAEAEAVYLEYVEDSKNGIGRAAGEGVILFKEGQVFKNYTNRPELEDE